MPRTTIFLEGKDLFDLLSGKPVGIPEPHLPVHQLRLEEGVGLDLKFDTGVVSYGQEKDTSDGAEEGR